MLFPYFLMVSFICSVSWGRAIVPRLTNESYWAERDQLMEQDIDQMLGYDITLTIEEAEVNSYLMALKDEEMQVAFDSLDFLPSKNFLEAKVAIDNSDIFRFISQMPKGAALHTHDMALTSIDWVVSELTYWDDLYICNTTENFILFKFFLTPDTLCPWKLVKDERENYSSPEEYDAYIFSLLSLYTSDVANTYPDINSIWEGFEHKFTTISGLVTYSTAWRAYLSRAMEEFMNDNIHYLEFRGVLPLLYEKDGREYTAEETVALYEEVIQNFTALHSTSFFGSRFIYAPSRLVDVDTVWGYVTLVSNLRDLYPNTVAGFDLVGQEDLGQPLKNFIDPLLSLSEKDPPIPVFFHAGETNWEGMSSDENIFDALLLNASRIGHGYAIVNHPSLIERVRQADIPVEVCPISNQVLMLVNDLRNHPMSSLASQSFPMVVSSDDPAIWEATPLSHDFYEAFMGLGGAKADLRFLKKLALNSIRYSSLDEGQKTALEGMWQVAWDAFVMGKLHEKWLKEMKETNVIPLN